MTKTLVALEWRKGENGDESLFNGPELLGWIIPDRSGNYSVLPNFGRSVTRAPTREDAMAALEAAVMALGVQNA